MSLDRLFVWQIFMIDELDKKILHILLEDSQLGLAEIASRIASSRTVVWNRVRRLRKHGLIKHYTIVVDERKLGIKETFFVSIKTNRHDAVWLEQFALALQSLPEVVEAHRLAGENDYLLKVQVAESRSLDNFYRKLISQVELTNVSSNLSMEVIKANAGPPLDNL